MQLYSVRHAATLSCIDGMVVDLVTSWTSLPINVDVSSQVYGAIIL